MNSGFPKTPRHIAETDDPYAQALRAAYETMIAEHTTGATIMPRDIEASWSKKGKPTTLTVRASFGHSINDAIVHDPKDPAPIAEVKMEVASRMMRLAFRRRRPPAEIGPSEIIPPLRFAELICPALMRRAIVHHRFGLDRLDRAFNQSITTRQPRYEIEYRPRGRSESLIPEMSGDTMKRLRVGLTMHPEGAEIEAVTLGIADGIAYKYAANSTLRHVLMIDGQWPATTCLAIAGEKLEDVILHEMFVGCGHIVLEAGPCADKTRLVLSQSYDTVRGY